MTIYKPRADYVYSGIITRTGTMAAPFTLGITSWIDCRGKNGFRYWESGSGNGPSGGASATFSLVNSHDQTASIAFFGRLITAGQNSTIIFSGGPYGWIGIRITQSWSGAGGTGTAALFLHIAPGVPGDD